MKISPTQIKNYANAHDVCSIIKTKSNKLNNHLKYSLDVEKIKRDKELLYRLGERIGVAKILERNNNEFLNINIRSKGNVTQNIQLEVNGLPIMTSTFGPINDAGGLMIASITKTKDGENFSGLAKLIDKLAVLKSTKSIGKGKVYLFTESGNLSDSHALAEPIHWSRGYIDEDYLNMQPQYDKKMQKLFDLYKTARAQGKSIQQAKKAIGLKCADSVSMILKPEVVKQHQQNTVLLELF